MSFQDDSITIAQGYRVSETAFPRILAGVGALVSRRKRPARRLPWLAMLPTDIGLFLKSARTDARVARVRRREGARSAFESAYRESDDPWASASPFYRYQGLKYEKLVSLLPGTRFGNALDLGCGLGLLSQKLSSRVDSVLGIDISHVAIEHARRRAAAFDNLAFEAGDILNLRSSLDGKFDLVVVVDVLYYLFPLNEDVLHSIVQRIAGLLTPGGTCLLANHFFFSADPDSRASRKIHRAFEDCPRFAVTSEHRKAFFLATLFSEQWLPPPWCDADC
jgi:SAM-dependent methyltransferase